jgi:UDPglucose 6-dehydrogenase
LDRRTLRFTADCAALRGCDVVFVCVPTPTRPDGSADVAAVESVVDELGRLLVPGAVVAIKSTVPVGTSRKLSARLAAHDIATVSNPEFLREGHAVYDFCHPDRVVIGAGDTRAGDLVEQLYRGDTDTVLRMTPESAELAKYASNAFLAVKLSYVNSLAQLCAGVGADIGDVTRCMGADPRIGRQFLKPGPGWGGSCLHKDTAALLHTGRERGVALREVASARHTNGAQGQRIATTLRRALNRPLRDIRVAAFGLTFKAGTSDIRDSPALAVCSELQRAGAQVTGYDPRLDAIDRAELTVATENNPYLAAKDADAILVLTEWPDFAQLDWTSIGRDAAATAVVLDTRNILDRDVIGDSALGYLGNGLAAGF